MNPQKIFDTVVTHLAGMTVRSKRENSTVCMYRGPGGAMCAVGCLITDEEYNPAWDHNGGESIISLIKHYEFPKRLAKHAALLYSLQRIHDLEMNWKKDRRTMKEKLTDIATVNLLNSDIINQVEWKSVA